MPFATEVPERCDRCRFIPIPGSQLAPARNRGGLRHTEATGAFRYLCPACVSNSCTECSRCEATLESGQGYYEERDGREVQTCADCYQRENGRCCNCETWYPAAQIDEDQYCNRCSQAPWGSTFMPDGRTSVTKTSRKFGVELETAKVPTGFKQQVKGLPFKSVRDGSIQGKEFLSHPMWGDKGLDDIMEFCNRMRGCTVDKTCGFHVHIDATGLDVPQQWAIVMGYRLTQRAWRSLVPSTRHENTYCRPMSVTPSAIKRFCLQGLGLGEFAGRHDCEYRYKWFNIMSYNKYRTLEVRLHSGTMDGEKITNWVLAHLRFWNWLVEQGTPKAVEEQLQGKDSFKSLRRIWHSKRLSEYYTARRALFASQPYLAEV